VDFLGGWWWWTEFNKRERERERERDTLNQKTFLVIL